MVQEKYEVRLTSRERGQLEPVDSEGVDDEPAVLPCRTAVGPLRRSAILA